MLQSTLECMCLFQLWFPQGICPVVGLLGYMPSSGIVGSYGRFIPSFFFFFKGISILFSIVAVSFCITMYTLDTSHFSDIWFVKFLPFCRLPFYFVNFLFCFLVWCSSTCWVLVLLLVLLVSYPNILLRWYTLPLVWSTHPEIC